MSSCFSGWISFRSIHIGKTFLRCEFWDVYSNHISGQISSHNTHNRMFFLQCELQDVFSNGYFGRIYFHSIHIGKLFHQCDLQDVIEPVVNTITNAIKSTFKQRNEIGNFSLWQFLYLIFSLCISKLCACTMFHFYVNLKMVHIEMDRH